MLPRKVRGEPPSQSQHQRRHKLHGFDPHFLVLVFQSLLQHAEKRPVVTIGKLRWIPNGSGDRINGSSAVCPLGAIQSRIQLDLREGLQHVHLWQVLVRVHARGSTSSSSSTGTGARTGTGTGTGSSSSNSSVTGRGNSNLCVCARLEG